MTEQSTGLDIEAIAREAGFSDQYGPGLWAREPMQRLVATIADRLASIPERMSTDPDLSADARRALCEAGAAIRAEVG